MEDVTVFERPRGRPRRPVPDAVNRLVALCYKSGRSVAVPLPPDTTDEELNDFRLDVISAARRINRRMSIRIDGYIDGRDTPVKVERTKDKKLWASIQRVQVRIYLPGSGSLRPMNHS